MNATVAERWGIAGHDDVVTPLTAAIAGNRVSHAYLVTGPEGVGRTSVARALARALNCEAPNTNRPCNDCNNCRRALRGAHPDVTLVDLAWQETVVPRAGGDRSRARQELSIDAVRWLRRDIVTRPTLGRWKVQIIDAAGLFSDVAPDAFLKTLEEPPPFAVIVLIAERPESVLETIRSRCQPIALGLVERGVIEEALRSTAIDDATRESLERGARGRIAWALRMASDPAALTRHREVVEQALEQMTTPLGRIAVIGTLARKHSDNRERTFALLDAWTGLWRDALLHRVGLPEQATYPDLAERLAPWAATRTVEELYRGVWATRRCAQDLDGNVLARVALQAMVTQWPA